MAKLKEYIWSCKLCGLTVGTSQNQPKQYNCTSPHASKDLNGHKHIWVKTEVKLS